MAVTAAGKSVDRSSLDWRPSWLRLGRGWKLRRLLGERLAGLEVEAPAAPGLEDGLAGLEAELAAPPAGEGPELV